jgi:phosphatidylserine decarboxylase
VPGRLFSVNPATTRALPGLFARNERVACLFDTAVGPMALVMVGALFVGSIETVWAGEVTPPPRKAVDVTVYPETGRHAVTLARGAELGRFNMGSTVILLFGPRAVEWARELAPETPVRMGQPIGRLVKM